MQTFCSIVTDARAEALLGPYADVMARAQRWQFRRIYHWNLAPLEVRKQAQARFHLTKRQVLANEFDLKQQVHAWQGGLDYRISQLQDRIAALTERHQNRIQQLKGNRPTLAKSWASRPVSKRAPRKLTPAQTQAQWASWARQAFQWGCALARLADQLTALKAERQGPPRLCFGGRKGLRDQQRFLAQARTLRNQAQNASDPRDPDLRHAIEMERQAQRSLLQWQAHRADRFLLVGSKGETAGNQTAQYDPVKQTLTLRLPNDQVAAHDEADTETTDPSGLDRDGRVTLTGIRFRYGHAALKRALARNQALTWLFFRDEQGRWHAHVTMDPEPVPLTVGNPTLEVADATGRRPGRIGVDLNVDHLAIVAIDGYGNPVARHTVPFPVHGTSSGQAQARVADAVKALTDLAEQHQVGLAAEDLDFTQKKAALKVYGKAHARRLSSWSYAAFRDALAARCARRGIHVAWVNPAYTSVIGGLKYAQGYAMSRHQAAALVIARRAQARSERFVCMAHASVLRPGTASFRGSWNGGRSGWARWRSASVLAAPASSARSGGRPTERRQPHKGLGPPPLASGGVEH